MELQIVDKEIVLELKELGFDWKVGYYFEKDKVYRSIDTLDFNNTSRLSAPDQALVCKWLRDVHKIFIHISPMGTCINEWRQQVYKINEGHYSGKPAGFHYKTYEQAEEAGIKEALKILKNNNHGNKES